ncbi:glycoside hydrolase family 97 protein [Lysobacter chinensis]|uniref:Glycoside hydrolase family 97 protein n=1 Tax=Marilutibacter chinensis TaxID=2912247 RepID=A0ABS9HWZ4_9GAMM|nr:glycoside hydrolase family 97 protein [Lysobacter chinensis]MCF7222882.1 glycoside hydrolase family 97 protein [Lysobacter chinensis]
MRAARRPLRSLAAALALAATAALAPLQRVHAETVARVESPGKVLAVELDISEGRLAYRVLRFGEPVIDDSRLGFRLRGAEKLERNLALASQSTRGHDETWEQPWGESRFVRDHHNELRARFTETLGARRSFDVVVRVFDDGLGFRYEFPEQPGAGELIIDDELTEFAVHDPATAWWIPAGEWNRYEYLYQRTPLEQVTQAHTTMTVRTEGGLHIAFHEAALVDYSGMWLRRTEGQRFRAQLAPASEGWKVRRRLPFHTPWRTLQITDTAAKLYESSDLILNLNEPNRLGDVSWFEPAKYIGIWWSLHLDTETWATGKKHGATTANTRRYIDFAAEHGFRGVLVEGWNPGWDGNWFGNGYDFDFTRATPDFDIEALSAHAASKGVHLIGHHETACAVSHYEDQMEDAFAMNARLGIDAVKTGYVCDAGGIERRLDDGSIVREWHDGQWNSNHHLRVLEAAARHKVAINAHEPIKDTGLRRTYPNWVSREGARGMEYAAWGDPPNPPEHETNLVFTRMLSGPMDFTPGILSLQGRGQAIQTTLAKQLALYVVLYSPVQMAADLPENYARHMDAFQFIKDVPADWAETRVLDGEVGDFVTFARKDRDSDDWYLGSISDEHGRLLEVPLSFLEPGRRYTAQIYRDGDGAHWRDKPFAFEREQREVTSADVLTLKLAAGGGQAIRFVAH